MANYSANPQTALQSALARGYSGVRFQQGKPILDRELNLASDLASPVRLAQQYIGDGVADGSQGIQIAGLNVAGNDFNILPGMYQVGGRQVTLAAQTTYKGQPNNSQVKALPAGASNVYLHVFTAEVTASQDSDLNNGSDLGFETAVREKTDWEVVVSAVPVNASDHALLAVINTGTNTVTDARRTGLTLASVRDELVAARGTSATVSARLASEDQALATVQTEITTARGTAAQLGARLNASLAGDGSIKPGTVSVQKMAGTLVLNAQFSVAAAPSPTQPALQPVSLANADDPGFFLVSVHFDGPRGTGLINVPLTQNFDWQRRVVLFKPIGSTVFNQHIYQVVLSNPNAFAISVTVKAYRLAEV